MSKILDMINTLQNEITVNKLVPSTDTSDIPIDDEYVTHRTFDETQEIKEQEEPKEEPKEDVEKPEQPFDTNTPETGADMDMSGVGGIGEEKPEILSPSQIGRVYELKKIYTRLSALEMMLQDDNNKKIIELRNLVSKAIDLFKTLSSNFDSYKDNLDDIIVTFYKFLDIAYQRAKTYFKSRNDEE